VSLTFGVIGVFVHIYLLTTYPLASK